MWNSYQIENIQSIGLERVYSFDLFIRELYLGWNLFNREHGMWLLLAANSSTYRMKIEIKVWHHSTKKPLPCYFSHSIQDWEEIFDVFFCFLQNVSSKKNLLMKTTVIHSYHVFASVKYRTTMTKCEPQIIIALFSTKRPHLQPDNSPHIQR